MKTNTILSTIVALSLGLSLNTANAAKAASSPKKKCLTGKVKVEGKNSEFVSTGITLSGEAGAFKVSGNGSICVTQNCKNEKDEPFKFSPPQGLGFATNGKEFDFHNTRGIIGQVSVRFDDINYNDNSGSYRLNLEWCPQ